MESKGASTSAAGTEAEPRMETTAIHSLHSKTYIFRDEDHTLGNSLRYMLMRDPTVDLCGYTIPHPMEAKMNMRIQTSPKKNADQALKDGLKNLVTLCEDVKETFSKAYAKK
mmetsp:Transcript_728/g.900  ORF Transcript_728/g.900 Transcript_728/m.900 type:complete len:112 (-) Transcript_728:574-909(-)|eukprot:CAMPEP_0204843660 /NCGR_PEP_ID=MMETSP1346-20131115/48111_1 /ASSEMBLY_ACC=CAM_ASM_000771 /TAXON_ID=215587 /ORGANISM="Aplanochytrium stocchinoi, Strain GSBS06" /LENGTH=111 /DNA_ID=CAMNT_0051982843 /DNA_START=223 /DNA_END=558 /DNA_ORIENTATION=+